MTNIVNTNNQNLRLCNLAVGVLSTLRISLPSVPEEATRVEVILTEGYTHTAYGASYDSSANAWIADISAAQFPKEGKQKYEIAYLLGGKQFWDGQGWVEIKSATTGGITPSPSPVPARYVVTQINGYGAPNPDGEVRIPRTFVGAEDPVTTDTFIELDQYFNRVTGALFVLCSVGGALTWVQTAGGSSSDVKLKVLEIKSSKLVDEDGSVVTIPKLYTLASNGFVILLMQGGHAYYFSNIEDGKANFFSFTGWEYNTKFGIERIWTLDDGSFGGVDARYFPEDPVEPVGKNVEGGQSVTLVGNEYLYLAGSFSSPATIEFNLTGKQLSMSFLVHSSDPMNDATILGEDIDDRFVWGSASSPVSGSVKLSQFAGNLSGWKKITITRFRSTGGNNLYHLEAK